MVLDLLWALAEYELAYLLVGLAVEVVMVAVVVVELVLEVLVCGVHRRLLRFSLY